MGKRFERLIPVLPGRWGGLSDVSLNVPIGGVTWSIPRPLVEIGRNVVATPAIEVSGGDIVLRMKRWEVMQFEPAVVLPVTSTSLEAAVSLGRDFMADSSISWSASPHALSEWCSAYVKRAK